MNLYISVCGNDFDVNNERIKNAEVFLINSHAAQ